MKIVILTGSVERITLSFQQDDHYTMIANKSLVFMILVLVSGVLLAGCTSSPPATGPETPSSTPLPTMVATLAPTEKTLPPEPTSGPSIFDGPVTQPPTDLSVSVSAQKDPIYNQVAVVFDGGKGQQMLQSITVRTTTSDGIVTELLLPPNRGEEITFVGSKGVDRVQVMAQYKNGASYLIMDQTVGQTRAGVVTAAPTIASAPASSDSMYDGPVVQPPKNLVVIVDVEKDPVYRVITATFRGGYGQSLVKSIDMHAVLSDGTEQTENIASNTGNIAEIQGTSGYDKVQVVVFYKNGEQYKISENVFGPRG